MKDLIVLSLIICVTACSKNKQKVSEIAFSDFIHKELFLSDFASNIHYIPLDGQVALKHIHDVYVIDRQFVVATSSGVVRYNDKGVFLNRIGRKGRGPCEYLYGVNIELDHSTKTVLVLNSDGLNTVIRYDMKGNCINEIEIYPPIDTIHLKNNLIGQFYSSFTVESSELVFFAPNSYGFTKDSWVWTDFKGNILNRKKNFIPEFNLNGYYTCLGNFYKLNGKSFFWELFNDTIFEINNDKSYSPKYIFGRDKYRLTPDVASKLSAEFEFGKNVYKNYMKPQALFETSRHLFLNFSIHGNNYWAINDKNMWSWNYYISGLTSKKKGFVNNLDAGIRFNPSFTKNIDHENCLIDYIYPYQLKAHVASEAFKNSKPIYPEKKKKLEELADSLDENDNPVLMLVKLKE